MPDLSKIVLLPKKYASMLDKFSLPTLLHNTSGVKFSIALIRAISKLVLPPKFESAHKRFAPCKICSLDISGNHKSKHI